MDSVNVEQPKAIVTTVSAVCKNCGYVWDLYRSVETTDTAGNSQETERSEGAKHCPMCHPDGLAPTPAKPEEPQ